MHGLAFNVNNNLTYFDRIIPCGIFHKGVTSMKKLLGEETDFEQLKNNVLKNFGEVFGVKIENITADILDTYYKVPATLHK